MDEQDTSWGSVVATNPDVNPDSGQVVMQKKGRGRPKKEEPQAIPLPAAPVDDTPSSAALLQAMNLTASPARHTSPAKRKKISFSDDEADYGGASEDNEALALYNIYFEQPLVSKHDCKKRHWPKGTPTDEILKECKRLEALVSGSTPLEFMTFSYTNVLSTLEATGPLIGLPMPGLGIRGEFIAEQPKTQAAFRALLIKYPSLRKVASASCAPELMIFLSTCVIINESIQIGAQVRDKGINREGSQDE